MTTASDAYDERFSEYSARDERVCPPYGTAAVRHYGEFPLSDDQWSTHWSKIHDSVVELQAAYEVENQFGTLPFEIHVEASGGWIEDDVMYELVFLPEDPAEFEGPMWAVAFSGDEVIHSQASF